MKASGRGLTLGLSSHPSILLPFLGGRLLHISHSHAGTHVPSLFALLFPPRLSVARDLPQCAVSKKSWIGLTSIARGKKKKRKRQNTKQPNNIHFNYCSYHQKDLLAPWG